jgi:hypothetical protein
LKEQIKGVKVSEIPADLRKVSNKGFIIYDS